jgi:predicted transcriptional regulator
MGSQRRDKLDIMKDILMLCRKSDMRKTKIAYKSNLNFQKASEYIEWLKYHSLIQEVKKGVYKTSPAGEDMLQNILKLETGPSESENDQ